MARVDQILCPECKMPTRRVYLQSAAPSTPRYPKIRGWVFCENCERTKGTGIKRVHDPVPQTATSVKPRRKRT